MKGGSRKGEIGKECSNRVRVCGESLFSGTRPAQSNWGFVVESRGKGEDTARKRKVKPE